MSKPLGLTVSSEAEVDGGIPTVGMFGLVFELDDDWELDPRGSK